MVPWWRKNAERLPVFPVIVGVTGHRDIAPKAEQPVRDAVRQVLSDWLFWFDPALYVLTALADGADQLVAEEAMGLGIPIIAVAPMPLAAYRKTLKQPAIFDRYWQKAVLTLVLPEVTDPLLAGPCSVGHHDRQYEQLGVLLARRSHLLLALWNGVDDPTDHSGTSAVARMRRHGDYGAKAFRGSPMFAGADSLLDTTYHGPTLQIVTPRLAPVPVGLAKGLTTALAGTCLLRELPDPPGEPHASSGSPNSTSTGDFGIPIEPGRTFEAIRSQRIEDFEQIRKLNGQIARFDTSDQIIFKRQLGFLNVDGIPMRASHPTQVLQRLQAAADTAAQAYQELLLGHFVPAQSLADMLRNARKTWRNTRRTPRFGAAFIFTVTVPLAVLLYEIYVSYHGGRDGLWALATYLGLFGVVALYHVLYVSYHDWQGRFQDYRALAEGMRVQLYWAIASVSAAVSDHYLRKQSGELGWIQFALRGPALWSAATAATIAVPDRAAVRNGWIGDQATFFADREKLNRSADERGRAWAKTLLVCGLAVSAQLLLFDFFVPASPASGEWATGLLAYLPDWREAFVVLAATLPALAAFFSLSRDLRAYEHHAYSYALMRRMFRRAATEAEKVPQSDDEFKSLVRELGREALAENAEWLVAHRRRKIEQQS